MVAPLVPLVIAGVRIAAPVAAKYLAGKISRQAAIKASKELAKKPAKSILQKGKEITDKTGITGKKGRYKEARGKDGALVGTGKELKRPLKKDLKKAVCLKNLLTQDLKSYLQKYVTKWAT